MANLTKSHIFRQQKPLENFLFRHTSNSNARSLHSKVKPIGFSLILSLYHSIPIRNRYFIPLTQRLFTPMSASFTSHATSASKTVRVEIKGRVQGVFYRDWTVQNAKELGLKGWVRNRRDGSVEALFSGSSEKVEEMEQRCRRGPSEAMVTGLQVFPCDDDPGNSFERKPTA